jgi:hypothetical protein
LQRHVARLKNDVMQNKRSHASLTLLLLHHALLLL